MMNISDLFIVHLFKEILQLPCWWFCKFKKRDSKLWVFNSWCGQSYSDSAMNVYEFVLANHPEIKPVWITARQSIYNNLKSQGKPVVFQGSREAKKACKNAGFVFITQSAKEMEIAYINGAKQVWLWHGMPLKKIGRDINLKHNLKERIHNLFPQNRADIPDYFISTSHSWDDILKQAYPAKNIVVTGLPRNDVFFKNDNTPFIGEIDRKFNTPLKILYLPTFRDSFNNKGEAFNPFELYGFSYDKFNAFLEESNTVFFFKGHYRDIVRYGLNVTVTDRIISLDESMYSDLYVFIKDIDVLMTDYSSVYFDFLLLNKPVILAPFDFDDYCEKDRLFYFDYEEIEGIRAKDWNDVIDIIRHKRFYVPGQDTISKFQEYQDGNSSERVTDFILSLTK